MRAEHVHCSNCGKQVSGVDPELGLVVRAFVECPECVDQRSDLQGPAGGARVVETTEPTRSTGATSDATKGPRLEVLMSPDGAARAPAGNQCIACFEHFVDGEPRDQVHRACIVKACAQLEAVGDQRDDLLSALKRAVRTIRTWHGLGMGGHEAQAWSLYQASPEMTEINGAIARAEG